MFMFNIVSNHNSKINAPKKYTMEPLSLVREFIAEIWNKKETSQLETYIQPAYTIFLDNTDPWEGKTIDIETFKTRLQYSFSSFPDIHFNIQSAVADGDAVAITWIMTGTHLGNIGAFQATHNTIETFGSTIYHIKDGKIAGHSQVFDRTRVMHQLMKQK
jgi:steroid delta-isomerase-like uncharacterized protein